LQRRFLNGKNQDQAAPQELPNFFKESKPGPNVLLKEIFTTLVGIQTLPA
jgi:hypothetical protein